MVSSKAGCLRGRSRKRFIYVPVLSQPPSRGGSRCSPPRFHHHHLPSRGHLQPPGISEEGWQGAPRGRGLPRQGFASSSLALFFWGALCRRPSAFGLCALLHLTFTRRAVAASLLNLGDGVSVPLLLSISSFDARAAAEVHLSLLSELAAGKGRGSRMGREGRQARSHAQALLQPGLEMELSVPIATRAASRESARALPGMPDAVAEIVVLWLMIKWSGSCTCVSFP